jgi:hypothetical protein
MTRRDWVLIRLGYDIELDIPSPVSVVASILAGWRTSENQVNYAWSLAWR